MKEKLHTADHILFTLLENKYGAKTKAMGFGDNASRVDYECQTDLILLKNEIEKETNNVINRSLAVKFYELSREEAKKITDLSLVPESAKKIKIYEIVGYNRLACGGPHVKNTKEIGKFKILKIKKKGKNIYSIRYAVE